MRRRLRGLLFSFGVVEALLLFSFLSAALPYTVPVQGRAVVGIEQQPRRGKVVFVLGRGAMLAFYAHLDAWAPGLHVGQWVREGDLLGVVDDTGNARGTVPHLHFETRPAATLFAPVDPRLVVGPRAPGVTARTAALVASLPEKR